MKLTEARSRDPQKDYAAKRKRAFPADARSRDPQKDYAAKRKRADVIQKNIQRSLKKMDAAQAKDPDSIGRVENLEYFLDKLRDAYGTLLSQRY